jgi:hypothetical protein
MIWLALGFALTAWAGVAAYGIWAWRDDRRAARVEKREEQERLNASFDSIQRLILQWTKIREAAETPTPPPFPAEGDNFTAISETNIARPHFGQRKPDTQPDGVA